MKIIKSLVSSVYDYYSNNQTNTPKNIKGKGESNQKNNNIPVHIIPEDYETEFPPLSSSPSSSYKLTLKSNGSGNQNLNQKNNNNNINSEQSSPSSSSTSLKNNDTQSSSSSLSPKTFTTTAPIISKAALEKLKKDNSDFKLEIESLSSQLKQITKEKKTWDSYKDKELVYCRNEIENLLTTNRNFNNQNQNLTNKLNNLSQCSKLMESTLTLKIKEYKEEKKMDESKFKQLLDEIDSYKSAISKHISILNEKDLSIIKAEENLKKELDKKAQITSDIGLSNKCNESNLNNQLPMASDLGKIVEKFNRTMENYYMNTILLELGDFELASILRYLFFVSYKTCLQSFNYSLGYILGSDSPNNDQLYNFRCLLYSSRDRYITGTSESTIKQLWKSLVSLHSNQDDLEAAKTFIFECCKFIWAVLLSQPEAKFNENEFNNSGEAVLYSESAHTSFGSNKGEHKKCVHLTIIPSIYLVRDEMVLSKSCVLLKPLEEISQAITPTADTTTIDTPSPVYKNDECHCNSNCYRTNPSSIDNVKDNHD